MRKVSQPNLSLDSKAALKSTQPAASSTEIAATQQLTDSCQEQVFESEIIRNMES